MKFLLASCLLGAAAAQHKALYHMEAGSEPVCFETTYIDEHFKENGFVFGVCPSEYNTILSHDKEVICNGHSEENVKYCPGDTITIDVVKLGKKTRQLQHKPMYYLQAEQEAVCYETTYIDDHFKENGFALGTCDDSYNIVLSHDDETVCNGHSEENVKYCPGDTITIDILKLGRGMEKEPRQLQHKPLYYLQAAAESICFETTYIDDHFKEEGFSLGSCDESYDVVLAHDDQTVCNGHSEENIKYCPGDTIDIDIVKLGRSSDDATDDEDSHKPVYYLQAEQESVCYETTYIDEHFKENGFKLGSCDESYDKVLSRDDETICNGHSEENVKYCPGDTITIVVVKFGKN